MKCVRDRWLCSDRAGNNIAASNPTSWPSGITHLPSSRRFDANMKTALNHKGGVTGCCILRVSKLIMAVNRWRQKKDLKHGAKRYCTQLDGAIAIAYLRIMSWVWRWTTC